MYQKMKESGLTDVSFDMHLTLWGQYLVLSHPESPWVHWEGCCRS